MEDTAGRSKGEHELWANLLALSFHVAQRKGNTTWLRFRTGRRRGFLAPATKQPAGITRMIVVSFVITIATMTHSL